MKVTWEYLSVEVDKLYQKEFDPSNVKGINEHCEYIAEYIRACGWTETEYLFAYGKSTAS